MIIVKNKKNIVFLLLVSALLCMAPAATAEESHDFIKWVDFDVTYSALSQALDVDISHYGTEMPLNWVDLLAYLGAKYGGEFSKYKSSDLHKLVTELESGTKLEDLAEKYSTFDYYHEVYSAVLGEFVGEYKIQVPDESDPDNLTWEDKYGLKAFSPIAKNFYYTDYRDFGSSRNYGYARRHLGHDMFGLTGTPVMAVESGIVEVMGWNQYGGWRIGIRSFDGLRYYYYAHMRQNRPYHCDLEEGQVVKAGDIIGYLGHTGYSTKENANNIREPHLHFGMQLIFDESQKEGAGEIWIDVYAITELLKKNTSETYRVAETKEFYRKYDFNEPILADKLESEEETEEGEDQNQSELEDIP